MPTVNSKRSWVEATISAVTCLVVAVAIIQIVGGAGVALYAFRESDESLMRFGPTAFVTGVGTFLIACVYGWFLEVLRRQREMLVVLERIDVRLSRVDPPRAPTPPAPSQVEVAINRAPERISAFLMDDQRDETRPDPEHAHAPTVVRIRFRRPGGSIHEKEFTGHSTEKVRRQAERQGYEVLELVEVTE